MLFFFIFKNNVDSGFNQLSLYFYVMSVSIAFKIFSLKPQSEEAYFLKDKTRSPVRMDSFGIRFDTCIMNDIRKVLEAFTLNSDRKQFR